MSTKLGQLKIAQIVFIFTIVPSFASARPTNSEFKIGITQEFETLNPLIMSMSATSYMARLAIRTLVNLDANSKWVPQLAKEIPSLDKGTAKIIEVGGKKKIVTQWEILEKASWGDGKPVICEDFQMALRIATSPHVSIGEKETYAQIEKIEWDPKAPKKCTFTFAKARWDFFRLGSFFPVPKHIEEPVFQKYGSTKEGYEKNSVYSKKPTTPGLYNGPYLITEVNLGDHLSFGVNPHFYGAPANIKKIIFKLIPNTGTLEANLRSGTIDMISTLGLALDQALVLDKKVKNEKLPYEVLFTPSVTYEHIDLNLDNPILKDVKVRRALLFGMNRDELALALFEGRQQTALHFISPKDPWFTSDSKFVQPYRYSRNQAAKLLDEAGWLMEPDGIRAKGGKKLSLSFMTTAGNKTRELVQVYLQEQWKQVGIEVTIKNEPARVFFSESAKKRKYGGLAMFAWVSSPETSPRPTLHSKSVSNEKNGWSGQNWMNWINPQVDKNIEALEVEFNPKKRVEIVAEILKAYTEDVPVLPLYYRSDITVIPKNLKNFRVPGHQYPETNEVETWTLE
ncbi:MAG: peptide ABC transporter substrate-binding protein [Bdellovibrionaceae bacterium]|nr:peptide ABC transporter substrate-binding protein [Pseudobdellovibrionaceae bacterium]